MTRLGRLLERILLRLRILATDEESARYAAVDDELRRKEGRES